MKKCLVKENFCLAFVAKKVTRKGSPESTKEIPDRGPSHTTPKKR